jgi:8-oxo-dGTP diphosphatase
MERHTVRAAVYLILVRDGAVFMLRRANTSWRNGQYTLVAGHIDGGETLLAAMCREAQEEAGITVKQSDLKFAHAMHHRDGNEYIDVYFEAKTWEGEPKNAEPERADEIGWFRLADLPENTLPNVRQALAEYQRGSYYSEFGWEK